MKRRALIVDDQKENRYLLRAHLESLGWNTTEALNGDEALALARNQLPDLIFSDVLMPGMDGFNLCRAWKEDEKLRQIPFVFCTATFTDSEDEALAAELGADGYVREPIVAEDLRALLDKLEAAIEAGDPPNVAQAGAADTTLLRDYSNVMARKLNHKVTEYHDSIEELRVSREELRAKSVELEQRVKELTCLYTIGNLARDPGVDFAQLCRETANEIASALGRSEQSWVRVVFDGCPHESADFRETPHRRAFEACPSCTGNRIEVYLESLGASDGRLVTEEEEMLIRSLGNLLCLEFRRHQQQEIELSEARRSATLLRLADQAVGKSESELICDFLAAMVKLTESRIGYAYLVEGDGESVCLIAKADGASDRGETRAEDPYPLSQAGKWADCARTRQPAVENDGSGSFGDLGAPAGCSDLQRHLSVPLIDGETVKIIVGVGDRAAPYLLPEIETLQKVANAMWLNVSRWRVEQRLRQNNDRLHLLETGLTSALHTIVITDVEGTIEWVNPAFTKATGYEADEAIGENPRILKSGRQCARFYEDLWATITAGKVWVGNLTNKRKDGTFYDEEAVITPVLDEAGKITHFIAIKEDVTEKHRMENQLLRSQRMESIGLLAGGVAHDLNNVLAPIMMSIELLKEQDMPATMRDDLIESLDKGCQRGAGIIRQVLTFARGVEGDRVLVQVRHLVKDLISIAKETFPKNIEMVMNIPANLSPVSGDATQLHQVLMNLTLNARDAMPNGGRLEVSGGNVTLENGRDYLDVSIPPGKYVRLIVADNGVGIPAAKVDRVFEPFFTTKELGKGTGLGLPTSLGIVKSHHGLLEVESAVGAGTRFTVYLPVADAADEREDIVLAMPARGHGETILLVDDEEGVRNVMGHALKRHGYKVLTASDGAEGVGIYARQMDEIDLVISDIMMPIMDGVAMVRALASINPEVRVMGCSGFVGDGANGGLIEDLRKLGVCTVLSKPFAVDELLRAVATELNDS